MNTDIGLLDPMLINEVWADVVTLIEEKGSVLLETHDLRELYTMVLSGHYELWLATESDELSLVCFCGWERHAKTSFYHVLWLGGRNLKLAKAGLEKVEHYACMHGASELLLEGRKGWARALRDSGYVEKSRLCKPVSICWRQ